MGSFWSHWYRGGGLPSAKHESVVRLWTWAEIYLEGPTLLMVGESGKKREKNRTKMIWWWSCRFAWGLHIYIRYVLGGEGRVGVTTYQTRALAVKIKLPALKANNCSFLEISLQFNSCRHISMVHPFYVLTLWWERCICKYILAYVLCTTCKSPRCNWTILMNAHPR